MTQQRRNRIQWLLERRKHAHVCDTPSRSGAECKSDFWLSAQTVHQILDPFPKVPYTFSRLQIFFLVQSLLRNSLLHVLLFTSYGISIILVLTMNPQVRVERFSFLIAHSFNDKGNSHENNTDND